MWTLQVMVQAKGPHPKRNVDCSHAELYFTVFSDARWWMLNRWAH